VVRIITLSVVHASFEECKIRVKWPQYSRVVLSVKHERRQLSSSPQLLRKCSRMNLIDSIKWAYLSYNTLSTSLI